MKASRFAVLAIIVASTVGAPPARCAQMQTTLVAGNAEDGRTFALRACTGCHVVAPDQPFEPIYAGPPSPPTFKEVANQPKVTAASLRHHLETLPAVPKNLHMANPLLSSQELRDVVAFIITLRDKPVAPPR
jgi:mono/diheme cytochrome c family protein